MGIEIKRPETDDEIRGKAYVHWKAWHEAYAGLVDQSYLDRLTLEKCEQIAFQWPGNGLIAKEGEKVVGFAACGPYRGDLSDTGEISALYILSGYYGSGLSRRLMDAAVGLLDQPRIAVWVLKGNRRAIRFYEKCGFRFDGCEKELNLGSPVTEARMILTKQNTGGKHV